MIDSGATFSPCGNYRYDLWRRWDMFNNSRVVFIGLNPSTADARQDDPTIRRCIGFAKRFGYGGLVMLNLFAFRATFPADMMKVPDPTGGRLHDFHLIRYAEEKHAVIAAWGSHGGYLNRDRDVLKIFPEVYCLGTTKDGFPKHPLYLRGDSELIEYSKKEVL